MIKCMGTGTRFALAGAYVYVYVNGQGGIGGLGPFLIEPNEDSS